MNKKNFLEGIMVGIVLAMSVNVLASFALPALNGISAAAASSSAKVSEPGRLSTDIKLDKIHNIIDKNYVGEYSDDTLEDSMYWGLVAGLDDVYSSYMSKDEFTIFNEQTEGQYAGIGAVVTSTEDGRVMVVSPYDGSPAANAGILPKDIIMEVNGMDTRGAGLDTVVSMMKGEPGTSVNITLYREMEGRTFDVTIVRDTIIIQTVSHKMIDENIGYIRLSGFERVTYKQFVTALNSLKADGADGFILDVRNNPGGLLDTVADITNLLVPSGDIVYTEDKNGEKQYLKSDKHYLGLPIILLVNGNSASASEVMAGAIKDHGVGVLIGEQTFGKGVVQNIFPLEDGSAVKVTIAHFYSPNGICIHGEGITPDHIVEMDPELSANVATLTYEEDIQLQKAVEVITEMIEQ